MKNILLMLLLFSFYAQAQRKKQPFKERPFTESKTAISFNPFALAEIDFTALAGYEVRLASKLYLSTEAGYILHLTISVVRINLQITELVF